MEEAEEWSEGNLGGAGGRNLVFPMSTFSVMGGSIVTSLNFGICGGVAGASLC